MTILIRPRRVAVDPDPDERGNVMAVALCPNGRMIALSFNAN
jgi:hypothetical protein